MQVGVRFNIKGQGSGTRFDKRESWQKGLAKRKSGEKSGVGKRRGGQRLFLWPEPCRKHGVSYSSLYC